MEEIENNPKRMSTSDSGEMMLGLPCHCSPLLVQISRICTVNMDDPPLYSEYWFYIPFVWKIIPGIPLQSGGLLLPTAGSSSLAHSSSI